MKLWGKTMAELDEDHRRMLADRLARQQNATPQQLGQYYGDMLQPHKPTQQERLDAMVRETGVPYYFGTDIPLPLQETEVVARYVRRSTAGRDVAIVAAVAIIGVVLLAIIL